MTKTLDLFTSDNVGHKFEMKVISWVHDAPNGGTYSIDITAIPKAGEKTGGGQLLFRLQSPVAAEPLLSQFHDKLLSALGRFDTQITAYINTPTIHYPTQIVDLTTNTVYLIVS